MGEFFICAYTGHQYIIDADNPLFEKIDRLDNVDRIKTEGYADNLLENDKYKTPVSESVS